MLIKTHTEESIEILAKAKKYAIRDMARTVRHEMNYYLSLKQSIFNDLEGVEQWAMDNNIVERKTPRNYLEMIDFSLLEENRFQKGDHDPSVEAITGCYGINHARASQKMQGIIFLS